MKIVTPDPSTYPALLDLEIERLPRTERAASAALFEPSQTWDYREFRTALVDELSSAATDRKVELVGASAQARYRVRGYLSTSTEDGETKVAYVWDVFDAQKRRAKRLAGSSPVPASSISDLDKATLAKLAQASMDEIAEFLTAAKSEAGFETPAAPEAPIQTAEVSGEEPPVAMQ